MPAPTTPSTSNATIARGKDSVSSRSESKANARRRRWRARVKRTSLVIGERAPAREHHVAANHGDRSKREEQRRGRLGRIQALVLVLRRPILEGARVGHRKG